VSIRGAELLIVGFEGPVLREAERRILRRLQPGGVILFGRNVESPEQLHALIADVRGLCPGVLLFVDAEGGRVDRLRDLVGRAPAAERLANARPAASRQAGRWVGRALRLFDFDVDFAPVVDLDRGERDNALDGRTYGASPRATIARAGAFLVGLHDAGIGGCLKHFPGLGAARMDTHREGAPIEISPAELARDLAPFAALAGSAGMVMASHATYPALDEERRPATLSPAVATRLLRRELRFRGVLVSDDLEMGALASWGSLPERCASALAAGCDLLPVCRHLAECPDVASALGAVKLKARREEAAERRHRYLGHLRSLRRRSAPARSASLDAIRAGLSRLGSLLST
jgi:beta-N-acetylhexosaminidase